MLAALGQRLEQLEPGRAHSTEAWFESLDTPALRTALFLALLELARLGSLLVYQPAPFSPIWIQRPGSDSCAGKPHLASHVEPPIASGVEA